MIHAETQLFVYIIIMMKMVDEKLLQIGKEFADFVYLRMQNVGLRTLDYLCAKALYMISIIYEKNGLLNKIRPMMFESHKNSSLRQDQQGQATAMNIILRSYLDEKLYDQARNFITKTTFPE